VRIAESFEVCNYLSIKFAVLHRQRKRKSGETLPWPATGIPRKKREWDDCFVKFDAFIYCLTLLHLSFTKRPEVNVAKTTTSGNSHDMRTTAVVELVE